MNQKQNLLNQVIKRLFQEPKSILQLRLNKTGLDPIITMTKLTPEERFKIKRMMNGIWTMDLVKLFNLEKKKVKHKGGSMLKRMKVLLRCLDRKHFNKFLKRVRR